MFSPRYGAPKIKTGSSIPGPKILHQPLNDLRCLHSLSSAPAAFPASSPPRYHLHPGRRSGCPRRAPVRDFWRSTARHFPALSRMISANSRAASTAVPSVEPSSTRISSAAGWLWRCTLSSAAAIVSAALNAGMTTLIASLCRFMPLLETPQSCAESPPALSRFPAYTLGQIGPARTSAAAPCARCLGAAGSCWAPYGPIFQPRGSLLSVVSPEPLTCGRRIPFSGSSLASCP